MKPLTNRQLAVIGVILFGLFCFTSNDDYHTLYVEQYIAQGIEDELAKPRLELVSMQEDADKLLALGEMK